MYIRACTRKRTYWKVSTSIGSARAGCFFHSSVSAETLIRFDHFAPNFFLFKFQILTHRGFEVLIYFRVFFYPHFIVVASNVLRCTRDLFRQKGNDERPRF
jgi:hypothetical protein